MTEVEYIGVGKSEKPNHPLVKGVRTAVENWWMRVGPGSVEKSWVRAHERIMERLDKQERKEAFAMSSNKWKRFGKVMGIAATGVDFGLAGLSIFIGIKGWKQPLKTENSFYSLFRAAGLRVPLIGRAHDFYHDILPRDDSVLEEAFTATHKRRSTMGSVLATGALGSGSLGLVAGGPAHTATQLAAKAAEFAGRRGANTANYIDSGKAAEHSKTIGKALAKGVDSAAKFAMDHPEEIRKTVVTVDEINRRRAREKELIEREKQEMRQAELNRQYQAWLADMDPSLKSYYKQTDSWPPSIEQMLREKGLRNR